MVHDVMIILTRTDSASLVRHVSVVRVFIRSPDGHFSRKRKLTLSTWSNIPDRIRCVIRVLNHVERRPLLKASKDLTSMLKKIQREMIKSRLSGWILLNKLPSESENQIPVCENVLV